MSDSSRVGPPMWMRLLSGPACAAGGAGVDLGLLILRVGIGSVMVFGHGLGKYQMYATLDERTRFYDPFGMGIANSIMAAMIVELVCTSLVVLGLFTRVAAIPVVFTMAVAL